MSEFDKLLEDVAREWDLHACGDDACELEGADCLAEYLKRRLLPLLEAGQAMRDDERSRMENTPRANKPLKRTTAATLWDKQKRAAMEGR